MTTATDNTALDVALSLPQDVLQQALQQKTAQAGIDRLKAIVESTDPAHKTIQDALIKKVAVWFRKNAPKRAYTGKPRGRKPKGASQAA